MTSHTPARSRRAVALLTALAVAGMSLLSPIPASAAPQVSITSELGTATVSADGPTTITVSGTGFQSIQGGFGGIYVFFGWVSDGWEPSQGGRTGEHYLYVPDTEAKDNEGYQRFVTFPGSSTAETANGGELAADGTFSLSMVVPGPRFSARDRDGNVQEVDCLQVTCGVITVGAHGVVNSSNETFTPVQFTTPGGHDADESEPASTDAAAAPEQGAGAAAEPPESAEAPVVPAATDQESDQGTTSEEASADADQAAAGDVPVAAGGVATVGLDQSTIVAGRVLAFTGQGFTPGEQVTATLGAGHAVIGPLTVGQYGEVVGTFALPADMRAGTHVLRLTGAASQNSAQAEVSVVDDPTALVADAEAERGDPVWPWAFVVAVVLGSLLLILIGTGLITAIRRRRAAKGKGKDEDRNQDGDQDQDADDLTQQPDDTAAQGAANEVVR